VPAAAGVTSDVVLVEPSEEHPANANAVPASRRVLIRPR
jgi:hypothetical protein